MKTVSKNHLPNTHQAEYSDTSKARRRIIKSFEARANNNRTITEKIADVMTSSFGSMTFLILNVLWFFIWILINTGILSIVKPFDPFPFGLLTMIVSLEAIVLAIIVLISQNRASKVDDIREEISLQITTIAEEEVTKIMELQVLMLKKLGIDTSMDKKLQQMLEPTDKNRIQKVLEQQIK